MDEVAIKIEDYRATCAVRAQGHFRRAHFFAKWNLGVGIPLTLLSAVVGSSVIFDLGGKSGDHWVSVLTGLMSLTVTIAAALQTFLRFSEQSAANHASAVAYEALQHRINLFEIGYTKKRTDKGADEARDPDTLAKLEEIGAKFDMIAGAAPVIPYGFYCKLEKQYAERRAAKCPAMASFNR